MQGEVLLLLRKRQGKSLLMSWRVQQERKNVYRVAMQMAKSRQDVVGVNCVKDADGKVLVENDIRMNGESIWKTAECGEHMG